MSLEIELARAAERLAGTRVLCVGDAMLDRYVYGAVERISPEAPVPVLRIEQERSMLGGAGNVVRNIVALGAEACFVAVVGRDAAARELTGLLAEETAVETHLIAAVERTTTIKTRFIAGSQQLLRADSEVLAALTPTQEEEVVARAIADIDNAAAVILSDYEKGVLSTEVLRRIIDSAREKSRPVVVDPKGSDFSRYRGATVVTPNRRELHEATGLPVGDRDEIVGAARILIETAGVAMVLVTRSQDGMLLVRHDRDDVLEVPAAAREVFDVSGAGDTVAAVLATALGAGIDIDQAVRLSNAAAGIVVGKTGTAVATAGELAGAFRSRDLHAGDAKLLAGEALEARLADWRRDGHAIGFTNGCFDLLHPGHVSLLRQARRLCDRLVVGLNSDASVSRLKGPDRPVQSEAARAAVLGSLASVDGVVIFDEDTPLELIGRVRPDVLVKGADYTVETVVGADIVQSYGGRVELARLEEGFSTTGTIARINAGR